MTSLYVLPGIQTTASTNTTTGTVTMTPNTSAGNPASSFTEVARGTNATVTTATVKAAVTTAQMSEIYRLAYGNETPMPTPAPLNRETAVAVFMGQRTSGGYSISVERISISGSTLNVTVSLKAPQPGMITTTALTSPWVLVKVPGVFTRVNVMDTNGQPLR